MYICLEENRQTHTVSPTTFTHDASINAQVNGPRTSAKGVLMRLHGSMHFKFAKMQNVLNAFRRPCSPIIRAIATDYVVISRQ